MKSILRGMKPVVFIVIFTAILNLFYTPGDTVLVRFWIFSHHAGGRVSTLSSWWSAS